MFCQLHKTGFLFDALSFKKKEIIMRNENSLPDPAKDWFGFMAKISADSKNERIMHELGNLFPGEHCGNPECLQNCISAFEIGSSLGMELKSFIKNCIKEEIVPKWGCVPANELPFSDYVREPLKKCDYGYYYGEHPDKTDKQIEAALRNGQKASGKQNGTADGKLHGPDAGGDAAIYLYDEDLECDVHEDDKSDLDYLRNSIKNLLAKNNRTPEEERKLEKQRAELADLEKRVKAYQVSTFKGFENERFQKHDELIMSLVRDFNNDIKKGIGGTDEQAEQVRQKGYLDANLIKSMMIQESASKPERWERDPMTVNYSGDRNDKSVDKAKNELGLEKTKDFPSGDVKTNIEAGIRFLARKGFGGSGQAVGKNPAKKFDGWGDAVRRYGPGSSDYYDKISKREKLNNN